MLKQKYFLTGIFILSAERQPIKLAWRKIVWLLKEYTTTKNGSFIMNSDKTFSSPSSVADFCIGSSNNGWIVWKDKHGNTLDSVYRKQLE